MQFGILLPVFTIVMDDILLNSKSLRRLSMKHT